MSETVRAAVLAVDGGDSKTDVVLLDRRGGILGARRLKSSGHAGLGRLDALETIDGAIRSVCNVIGADPDRRPIADVGVYCLAGADLPLDDRRISRDVSRRGWTRKNLVRNDTFAVLRAGTDRGWGVGIVCGAGMNCTGVAPDGRVVRFPALGEISGDLAPGGGWIGTQAVAQAMRAQDGRGPRTVLEKHVPAHFKLSRPSAVVEAFYVGRLDQRRVAELPPLVFAAAQKGDAVARQIIDAVADEIVAFAVASIRRLRLTARDVDVILGGGIFRTDDADFMKRIERGVRAVAPDAVLRRLKSPPVVGAGLIGLDELGIARVQAATLRSVLTDARLTSPNSGR